MLTDHDTSLSFSNFIQWLDQLCIFDILHLVCLVRKIFFQWIDLKAQEVAWTYVCHRSCRAYLCPDSCAMVKAKPSPVSSLMVQLLYLLHIPLMGANPVNNKEVLSLGLNS